MAIRYVSPNGSNTSPYDTWEKAALLFKTANTASSSGDVIVLDDGDHVITGFVGVKSVIVRNKRDDIDYSTTRFVYDPADATSRLSITGTSPTFKGVFFNGSSVAQAQIAVQSNTTGSESTVTINGCRFSNARKTALLLLASTNKNNIVINDTIFDNNEALEGGAIWASENNYITADGCTFQENTATSTGGGAVYIRSTSGLTESSFVQCVFASNRSNRNGAAIFNADENITLDDCVILNNDMNYKFETTDGSGAVNNTKFILTGTELSPSVTTVTVKDCLFDGNFAKAVATEGQTVVESAIQSDGGGFMAFGGDPNNYINVVVDDTRFCNNFSMQGAGIYISRYASAVISRCLIDNNTAYSWGGGSARGGNPEDSEGFTSTYNFCAFVGNRAGYDRDGSISMITPLNIEGGALPIRIYPKVAVNHCTFINNYVAPGGKGDAISNGSQRIDESVMDSDIRRSSLLNCIFWNDEGVGNDVLITSLDNGWTSVNTVMVPIGQEWGAGITPVAIDLIKSPVAGSDTYTLKTGTRAERSAVIVAGVNDGGETDIAGNVAGAYPNIGADQYDYGVGFSPWSPCDSSLPTDGQVFKSHALPISAKKLTVFPGVASQAQINEAGE